MLRRALCKLRCVTRPRTTLGNASACVTRRQIVTLAAQRTNTNGVLRVGMSAKAVGSVYAREYAASAAAAVPGKYDWKSVKGFLFDIDGTLVDTDPLHLVAFRDCLKKAGVTIEVDHEFFKENISGRSNPDIARDLLPELTQEEKEKWIVDKEEYFCDLARSQIEPVKGLRELMAWIKSNGVKCAAVTNAPRPNAEMLLGGIGMRDEFDLLVIANEEAANKPHPEPYLAAMRRLGLSAEECCALEDSVPGATAAIAAGVHTIGVLTSQTDAAMKEAGVGQTIGDYHELLDEIESARQE
uniref:Haloacid dehalogenase-like hydrolase n=1 Tax=Chloropicon primus TaxID=1764295 RepID=A0A7S2T0B8_9CHLO|mmetsp:Transcript_2023/g.5521  ORF Transcript_2023/g.5521 Transcript_2023/m.5521 type:complete len:298 (+) Transcript_2023:100-993(+)